MPHYNGKIKDEVWSVPDINNPPPSKIDNLPHFEEPKNTAGDDWGEYAFVAQLLEDQNENLPDKWIDSKYTVRITYYRRPKGKKNWNFGGQFAPVIPVKQAKKFLKDILDKMEKEQWLNLDQKDK